MTSIRNVLKQKNMGCGWLYFYIHFMTEVVCFFTLSTLTSGSRDAVLLWFLPLFYDMLAFVPQSLIGSLADRFPRFSPGLTGVCLLAASQLLLAAGLFSAPYVPVAVLCLGNCCIHISGAEETLRCCGGKLSHSAIFVAGGSFGVISGKLLAGICGSWFFTAAAALTMIPVVLLAGCCRKDLPAQAPGNCNFNYASERIPVAAVILISVFVVMARGYMGYGIPTSWNKTVFQNVLLFCSMGVGKALGGILSDCFGVKRVAVFSLAAAFPFLLAGDRVMLVSLVGVMFFSMTMATTLAVLVSVLQDAPGLAFGLTTIGLFLGTAPVFFLKPVTFGAQCLTVGSLTALCIAGLMLSIRRDV